MQGLVKHIGISNFSVKKFEEVLSYARHPVAINQVEIHPYWRNDKLMAFAKSKVRHERPASLQDELGTICHTPQCEQSDCDLLPGPASQRLLSTGLAGQQQLDGQ